MPPAQSESPPAVESLQKNLNGWKNTAGRLLRSQGSNGSLNGKETPEWLAGRRANGANGVNGQTESNGVNGTKSINGASDTASTFNPFTKEEFTEYLTWFITDEKARPGLKEMFFRDGITDEMASTAAKMANALCDKGCGKEIAEELALLTLYDLVILIDDSRSMQREEGGKRIEALRKTLKLVANVFMLARPKKSQGTEQGINAVRFLNFAKGWTNVVPKATDTIIKQHTFRHWSRIGTELKAKVLDKHVFGKSMKKPLLVITITDGDVEGEAKDLLVSVIDDCIKQLKELHGDNGPDAIGFQFAKVGNDAGASRLLKSLDEDKVVGKYVDSFPTGIEVFDDKDTMWPAIPKLLLGGIATWWDDMEKDAEKPSRAMDEPSAEDEDDVDEEIVVVENDEDDDGDDW